MLKKFLENDIIFVWFRREVGAVKQGAHLKAVDTSCEVRARAAPFGVPDVGDGNASCLDVHRLGPIALVRIVVITLQNNLEILNSARFKEKLR